MRSAKWQNEASDAVSWHQDQALNATIFLLREVGPTSFLLKEEGEDAKFKVCLGDPHTCTCPVYRREKNPCKHVCWVILKKLKWPRNNELTYQFGLVEREITQLLQGPRNAIKSTIPVAKKYQKNTDSDGRKILEQRPITKVDVCPICQEEMLDKHLPVTYCRYGCGNNVHIKCMKIWADHQRQTTGDCEIKCPMCRENFGSFYSLLEEYRNCSEEEQPDGRLDVHYMTVCGVCNMSPIKGKCYKCTSCNSLHLCNTCFHANKHPQHSFVFRLKKSQRWRPAKARMQEAESRILGQLHEDLSTRDITDNDYDLLLQLDRPPSSAQVDLSGLPEHIINRLPLMKVRAGGKLLAPGRQCRLCLRSYEIGQYVRKLPECRHVFHRECIDEWLSNDHRRCPVDQKIVTLPSRVDTQRRSTSNDNAPNEEADADVSELMIPGVGIAKLQASRADSRGRMTKAAPTSRRAGLSPMTFGDLLLNVDSAGKHKEPKVEVLPPVGVAHEMGVVGGGDSSRNKSAGAGLRRGKTSLGRFPTSPKLPNQELWLAGNSFVGRREQRGDSAGFRHRFYHAF